MTKPLTIRASAEIYSVNPATIKRWKKKGMRLDDPGHVVTALARQRHRPQAVKQSGDLRSYLKDCRCRLAAHRIAEIVALGIEAEQLREQLS